MSRSFTSRAVHLFPPVRRLIDAIRTMGSAVERLEAQQRCQQDINRALQAEQARQQDINRALQAEQARLAEKLDRELDRWVAREMQSAAVRNLPFLPGYIGLDEEGIHIEGYAGAPEGVNAQMAFFVNGLQINRVEYPIEDPELKSRFPEVQGMGTVFRALMTAHLDQLRASRFWRLDASPTGYYVERNWRQAIHLMNPLFEQFPFPPESNIKRVIGDTSQNRFAMGGAIIFKNIEKCLEELGHTWSDFRRILDWGCGAGRLTRYLISESGSEVTGADIDADNISWCRGAYGSARFEVIPLRPPTIFADATFDLVTGVSVVTHLKEDDQLLWLAELKRITKPGALLFLSVRGPTQFAYDKFPPKLYLQVQRRGYLDLGRDPALDGAVTDSDYYRAAMNSRGYIVDRWSHYFDVLAIIDAIAGLQDFVIMRRR